MPPTTSAPSAPLVSLILPYHNRAATLPRTLASLLALQHRPLELLLVDNASTDESARLAADFAAQHAAADLHIHLLSEATRGACAARNAGLAAARGSFVAFFDSDDEISPHFLSALLPLLAPPHSESSAAPSDPRPQWCTTRSRMHFPSGRTRRRSGWAKPSLSAQLLGSIVSTQSWLARRDFLLRAAHWRAQHFGLSSSHRPQLWNEALPLWNDLELGLLLLYLDPRPAFHPQTFHRIYQHHDSLSGAPLAERLPRICSAFAALHQLIAAFPLAVQRQLFLSLRLRHCIVSQQLHAQLSAAQRSALRAALPPLADCPTSTALRRGYLRYCCALLRIYLRCGGRAAWRLALLLSAARR